MKSLAIKFVQYEDKVKYSLIFMLAFTVLLLSSYLFFLKEALTVASLREELDSKIASLHTKLSPLEQDFLVLKSSVTMDLAEKMGFSDISSNSKFIKSGSGKMVLSANVGILAR